MRVLNKYTDEFRRNVVSVLRSGMKVYDVARRLDVPISTIWGWLHEDKFASVGPASDEVLAALPSKALTLPSSNKSSLIKIAQKEEPKQANKESSIRVSYGKLNIEFANGLTTENLRTIIQALGGKDVL